MKIIRGYAHPKTVFDMIDFLEDATTDECPKIFISTLSAALSFIDKAGAVPDIVCISKTPLWLHAIA